MIAKLFVVTVVISLVNCQSNMDWKANNQAFDPDVYESVLDPELCDTQLRHVRRLNNTMLRLQFLDAGLRFPRGLLVGNTLDMGNYHQCLSINEDIEDSVIEGKYCMIQIPLTTTNYRILVEELKWPENDSMFLKVEEKHHKMASMAPLAGVSNSISRLVAGNPLGDAALRLAVCIPKTCTTQEGLLFNLTALGLQYEDEFCRFPNDKPWAPVDYVAISLFSFIGLLTLLSTGYDLCHKFVLKKDPKTASVIYRSFSVYTNARRLTTFSSSPNNLQCVDGIRTLATIWVIVGHTYTTWPPMLNFLDIWEWIFDIRSLWITGAPFTVDTFFMLSGALLVYTTAGKLSGMKFLKSLHLFYLNRILRMFPLLATAVLLQASILHRIADGPIWTTVETETNNCRNNWWSTLLYVQNYVHPENMCVAHSWYLAIDMQCYVVSPIILFWLLSNNKRSAWTAMTLGLLASLTIAAIYCFIRQFPGWTLAINRPDTIEWDYMVYYYYNTLARSPPFFVGMLFGYLLHLWKGKKLEIPIYVAILAWVSCLLTLFTLLYMTHLMKDFGTWNYWTVDDLNNSFGRAMWALAIGWIVFSCQYGYGGPINWFLSLDVWKLPSRISYGMYLFHYPIMFMLNGTALAPSYFSEARSMYEFLRVITLAFGVSFVLTLLIDSPCSTLSKILLGGGPKKPRKEVENKE